MSLSPYPLGQYVCTCKYGSKIIRPCTHSALKGNVAVLIPSQPGLATPIFDPSWPQIDRTQGNGAWGNYTHDKMLSLNVRFIVRGVACSQQRCIFSFSLKSASDKQWRNVSLRCVRKNPTIGKTHAFKEGTVQDANWGPQEVKGRERNHWASLK